MIKNLKNTKEILKNETGITLIALVVTIIVLIILAAVSINLLLRRKWNNNKIKRWKRKSYKSSLARGYKFITWRISN